MEVLFIPSWYSTEKNPTNGSFFKEQALALKSAGVNVILAYVEISLENISEEDSKVKIYYDNSILVYRIKEKKIRKTGNIGTMLAFKKGIKKIYKKLEEDKRGNFDIIHLHSTPWAGLGAVSISKVSNTPLVITEHSSYFSRYKVSKIEELFFKYIMKNAFYNICVSETLKKYVQKYTSNNIDIIPNMVNVDEFSIANNEDKTREKKFSFACVCYLNKNKSVDNLIKAFSLEYKGKDVELVIGGDGPEKSYLENLSKELEIETQVIFKGALSRKDVIKEMQNCNVFVLPSIFETFGVVLIEALACGKPVITTRNGGADGIVNELNGKVVDVGNIELMANAMKVIKDNYEIYNNNLIREDCIKRFSSENVANEIIGVYNKIISGTGEKYEK